MSKVKNKIHPNPRLQPELAGLRLSSVEVQQLFDIFNAQNPRPQTELEYCSPFTLLIAVVLSAQATDVGVNKATKNLFRVASTPQAILQIGQEGLESYIKTIGLYRSKAANIIKLCEILLKNYNGQVPNNREALESLPGVGRKTANVILNVAFGQATLAVDTHIFRVSQRLGLAYGKTPLAIEEQLLKVIPTTFLHHAHHWLILHGRYICKARKPECGKCKVRMLCKYPHKEII